MNQQNGLFLLMFTLSQMNEKVKIMKLFLESLNELFGPLRFFYSEKKPDHSHFFEEIILKEISYGFIVCEETPSQETIVTLQSAIQMLALILDRLRMDQKLKQKTRSLESVAKQRLDAIEANVEELESSKKESTALIENLKNEISQRQRIEKELSQSEEKFRLSFQTSPDAISINRLEDGTYIDINQGFTDISGYTADEIVGKSSYDIDIWVDFKVRDKMIQEVKKSGKLYNLQAKFRTKDGRIIDGLMSASLLKLNNVPHIINITRDVSEIKKTQDEFQKSELRFRKAFENSPYGMCLSTPKGEFLQVNKKLCEISGYTAEELLGLSFPEITLPEDIPIGKEDIKKTLKGQIDFIEMEKRYIRKNEDIILAHVSSSLIRDSEDIPLYFISHVNDITEKKKIAEIVKKERDQAQKYLDVAGVMFATLDKRGKITLINKKGCEIMGYDKAEDLIGKNWLDLCLPENDKEEIKHVFLEQMAGNIKAFEYYENPVVTKSGKKRIIAFHNTVLSDLEGNITGVLFSGEDITDREKTKKSLLEIQYQLSTIYNTVGVIIYYLKVEGEGKYRFISVNEMFCNATGLTMDQIIGKDVSEVIPEPSLSLVLSNYKRAIKEKSIVRWEEVTNYPTGKKIGEVGIAPVFNQQGNCTYLVGSVHDITELKKAEEEIKKLNAELGKRVEERTAELEEANEELEELNNVFVGREMRIIELKEEVERLKNKLKEK